MENLPVPGASVMYVAFTGSDASFASRMIAMNEAKCKRPAARFNVRSLFIDVSIEASTGDVLIQSLHKWCLAVRGN
jgi:hypothetical protein